MAGLRGSIYSGLPKPAKSALGSRLENMFEGSSQVGASLTATCPVMNMQRMPNGKMSKMSRRSRRLLRRVSSCFVMVSVH